MIHQVTQLQMQSSDDENSEYFISSNKKWSILYQYTINTIHLIATVLGVRSYRHSL